MERKAGGPRKRGHGAMSAGGTFDDEQNMCLLRLTLAMAGSRTDEEQKDREMALALMAAHMITKNKKTAAAAAKESARTRTAAGGGGAAAEAATARAAAAAPAPAPAAPAPVAPAALAAPATPPLPPLLQAAAAAASGDPAQVPMATRRRVVPVVRGPPLMIDEIVEGEAWEEYRFTKSDLRRLFAVLHFPELWVCQNGSRFPGETAFLLLLRRLRYPGRLSDLAKVFQRESSQLARLFGEVVDFVYEKHSHRITGFLAFWQPQFETMAGAIQSKGGSGCVGSEIFGFLDRTLFKTCRKQGKTQLQREFYDAQEQAYGITFQSLVLPNGMIGDVSGPAPGGEDPSDVPRKSELNSRLAAVQQGKPFQGKVHANSACANMSHVGSGFQGAELTDAQMAYNTDLSAARLAAVGQVGAMSKMFPFMLVQQNHKVMLSPVGKYYTIAALLTNAHTACYGCDASTHFGIAPPALEEYFKK